MKKPKAAGGLTNKNKDRESRLAKKERVGEENNKDNKNNTMNT